MPNNRHWLFTSANIRSKLICCGATLRSALPDAVGAPKGQRIEVTGLNNETKSAVAVLRPFPRSGERVASC
jgi:hypothetical protein